MWNFFLFFLVLVEALSLSHGLVVTLKKNKLFCSFINLLFSTHLNIFKTYRSRKILSLVNWYPFALGGGTVQYRFVITNVKSSAPSTRYVNFTTSRLLLPRRRVFLRRWPLWRPRVNQVTLTTLITGTTAGIWPFSHPVLITRLKTAAGVRGDGGRGWWVLAASILWKVPHG